MLLRSRPLVSRPAISGTTSICVASVSALFTMAFVVNGAINYSIQAAAFPLIYFALWAIARYQFTHSRLLLDVMPERRWDSVTISIWLAFAWGVVLMTLNSFMVLSLVPTFIHDFVRLPNDPVPSIRNTECYISTLLCIYVVLDYARLSAIARSNVGHRTIATALVLEVLLAMHFAVA